MFRRPEADGASEIKRRAGARKGQRPMADASTTIRGVGPWVVSGLALTAALFALSAGDDVERRLGYAESQAEYAASTENRRAQRVVGPIETDPAETGLTETGPSQESRNITQLESQLRELRRRVDALERDAGGAEPVPGKAPSALEAPSSGGPPVSDRVLTREERHERQATDWVGYTATELGLDERQHVYLAARVDEFRAIRRELRAEIADGSRFYKSYRAEVDIQKEQLLTSLGGVLTRPQVTQLRKRMADRSTRGFIAY
ncbi:MAG: hypothetical protein ACI9MR_001881 [Myxococcota bacterium]|jgi:hypothetical protein